MPNFGSWLFIVCLCLFFDSRSLLVYTGFRDLYSTSQPDSQSLLRRDGPYEAKSHDVYVLNSCEYQCTTGSIGLCLLLSTFWTNLFLTSIQVTAYVAIDVFILSIHLDHFKIQNFVKEDLIDQVLHVISVSVIMFVLVLHFPGEVIYSLSVLILLIGMGTCSQDPTSLNSSGNSNFEVFWISEP